MWSAEQSHEPIASIADGRRFHVGIFVGIDARTGQSMIHGGDQIMLARTVLRLPEANKWDRVELAKIAATPWDLHRPREQEVVLKEPRVEQAADLEGKIALARQPYI